MKSTIIMRGNTTIMQNKMGISIWETSKAVPLGYRIERSVQRLQTLLSTPSFLWFDCQQEPTRMQMRREAPIITAPYIYS